jgi:HTH-like domain
MRYRCVDAQKAAGFPVVAACQAARVTRSAYYAWTTSAQGAADRHREEARLVSKIRRIHARNHGTYGAPRVHAELRRRGWAVNHKRVERLMRVHGTAARAGRACPADRPRGAGGQCHRPRPSPPRRPCPPPWRHAWPAHGRGDHPATGRPGRLACRPPWCHGPAAAGWRGGGLLGPDPAGGQAGGRPCRLADRRPGRGPVGPGRDPSCSDPRAPAPSPHPGSNSAGTHTLNAATRVSACCSRPDYGWHFLGGGRECVGFAGYRAGQTPRSRPVADHCCGREWSIPCHNGHQPLTVLVHPWPWPGQRSAALLRKDASVLNQGTSVSVTCIRPFPRI